MLESDPEQLSTENAELRRRLSIAEAAIDELRRDALTRRAEIRSMAEALPAEVSRHALIRSVIADAVRHPDKPGVAKRALRKLSRAPVRAYRVVTGKQ